MDEIGNIPWPRGTSYLAWVHFLPRLLYNDRPIGSIVEFFLYRTFGFDYTAQLEWFVLFHFMNCVLAFLLLRKIGLLPVLSLSCVALFGSFSTTAQTATYLGAAFDVVCTTFLLASTLLVLPGSRLLWWLSGLFYLAALRTKEFAIVLPVILTILLLSQGVGRGGGLRSGVRRIADRLWVHYVILGVFGVWYLRLAYSASIPRNNPYHVDFGLQTIWHSMVYYVALIFSREQARPVWLPVAVLVVVGIYAVIRRLKGALFGLAAFSLTILPVSALPGIRSPYYVYCPAIFLAMVVGFFLQDVVALCARRRASWFGWTTVAAAAGVIGWGAAMQSSAYFQSRVEWVRGIRAVSAKTAADARREFTSAGTGSHIYVNRGTENPWLLIPGPCQFLRVMRNDGSIDCVFGKSEEELRTLYDPDRSQKYLVDYGSDGLLKVRDSAAVDHQPASHE